MLRFTDVQQQYIIGNRAVFNQRQIALNEQIGDATFMGNALPMPREVWGEWDREAVELQRQVLKVFNDLSASLARPMNIGKLIHHFQTVSDSGSVNISLDGQSKAKTDQPTFTYHGTPLPIIDSTFSYGWRQMASAATEGFSLDNTGRVNANYKVAEKLEDITLNGDSSIVVDGNILAGLRNHPKRNTRSIGVTLNGATGAQWIAEITALLKLLHDDNFKVPATIYMNFDDWFYAGTTEFTAGYPKTIAQRVMEIPGVQAIVDADKVPANEMIAVVKDRRVLQVLNGMPLTTRAQFRANPEDPYNFVTMAASALEVKFDAEDNCGIAHAS